MQPLFGYLGCGAGLVLVEDVLLLLRDSCRVPFSPNRVNCRSRVPRVLQVRKCFQKLDQFPEISGANQVMGVPTVVILKDGEIKERFVGVQPKEVIKEKILAIS